MVMILSPERQPKRMRSRVAFLLLFFFLIPSQSVALAATSEANNYSFDANFFANPTAVQQAIADKVIYPVGYTFQQPPEDIGGTTELRPPSHDEERAQARKGLNGGMVLMSSYTQGETAPSPQDIARIDSRTNIDMTGGAFKYSYPFDLPKGRNNSGPDLSLEYSSQDEDYFSAAGFGWSLNIPYIERKNENGTNKLYQQSVFSSSISGELATTSTAGVYAAKTDDGSYMKYVYASSTSMWTVTDKDGTSYLFGTSTSARLDNSASSTQISRWMLEEQRTANGDRILYTYSKDQGQLYLSSIQYVFTGSAPLYQIDLTYASSSAPFTSYSAGFSIVTARHLTDVSIKVNGANEKRYELTYTKSLKTNIDLLTKIQLVGLLGTTVTAPATIFEYQQDASGGTFANDAGWTASIPKDLYTFYRDGIYGPDLESYRRTVLSDVNGDGLADWIEGGVAYLNTGSGWSSTTTWSMPTAGSLDGEYRFADVNGDGLPDVMRSSQTLWSPPWNRPIDTYKEVYINNGDGTWTSNPSMASTIPVNLYLYYHDDINGPSQTYINRGYIVDMNGDGLADWVQGGNVYMNNGAGWETTASWSGLPRAAYDADSRLADVNGDNLPDITISWEMQWQYQWNHPTDVYKYVYLNNGDGTWTNDPVRAASIPTVFYTLFHDGISGPDQEYYRRAYILDIDGDGLNDFLYSGTAYLNTGTEWTATSTWSGLPANAYDGNSRIGDVNGDNLPDIVNSWTMIWSSPWAHADDVYRNVYLNQGVKPFVMASTTNQFGGNTSIEYTHSAVPANGVLTNPSLPMNLQVVKKVTNTDPVNAESWSTDYKFEGGDLYYESNDIFDRRFAGFERVTVSDAVGQTTSYYHQGNGSATSTNAEYGDMESKLGLLYRRDQSATSSTIFSSQRFGWDSFNRGGDAHFTKLATTTMLSYDGDAGHRDTAETYTYDNANGNVTQEKFWGEVQVGSTGTFADIGTDALTTDLTYAASSTSQLSLPSIEVVTDQSSVKVRETRNYYDGLTIGSLGKGDRTKQEAWVTSTTYAPTIWTYNAYGLPLTQVGPRGATTTFTYDAYNLYVGTTTNSLGHVLTNSYDYSSGNRATTTDANGLVHVSRYDSLDRIVEQKEPDLTTPATLVTRTAYVYTDGSTSSVTRTDYLDGSVSVPTITYLDGFGRVAHERKRAETSNTYKVTNTKYDVRGNVASQALPYFSTGTSKTALATSSALWKVTAYDALNRISSIKTAVGTTGYSYNDWTATTTDALGKLKAITYDAYGNLARVAEKNGGNYYLTDYLWDGNKSLTRITDALGNVRNFSYDGLGRMLTAQDLHASADTSFGSTTYAYDLAGNRTQQITPVGMIISYTYDLLNRVLTEDSVDTGYTDIIYGYDNAVHYGVGKLTGVSTAYNGSGFDYDSNGNRSAEQHVIPGSATTTTYYTYDRQGNLVYLGYPDGAYAYYAYNPGGLIESVQEIESGAPGWSVLVYNFDYSPLDQVTLAQYGNSTNLTNTYDQNNLYRLYSKTAYNPSIYFQYLIYGYDAVGNITGLYDLSSTNSAKTVNYAYDDLHRLTTASSTGAANGQNFSQSFSYNALGNLLTNAGTSYSYDGHMGTDYANPHAPTAVGGVTHTYDRNGNLLTDGVLTNTWDYRNQVTQTVATTTSTFTYNQDGSRISKTSGGLTTFYPTQNYTITSSGAKDKYVYANGQPIVNVKTASGTTTLHYLFQDHLGSTNVVTSATGTVENLTDYYPYGSNRINQVSGFDEQRKYIGQYYDSSSDLSYLNARYYDGGRGQFLSQDPSFLDIGGPGFEQNYQRTLQQHLINPQSLNSYSYGLNNPIINSDPEGEIVPLIPIALGALAFYGGYSAGTDLYEGYTSGDNGQFAWGVVGAAGSLMPGGGAAKGAAAFADDAARGATNLSRNFFRGGDVKFDPGDFRETLTNGKINPSKAVEGISVNLSQKWATAKGNGISTQIKSLPKGLQITQQGKNLSHYVIRPTKEMTVNQFKNLINKMNSRIKSKN